MADQTLFTFLTQLAKKEGAWIIEPAAPYVESDRYLRALFERLRHVPARISSPDPRHPYRFAERGAPPGRWLLVWVPDE